MDALSIALLLAIAFVPPVILVIRLRNAELNRREPFSVLWKAFAWGAIVAAAIAILGESLLERRFRDVTFLLPAWSVLIVLAAPIIEELAKALGLRVIPDEDPEPEDGYIYGGAVGLGFAATENVVYILSAYLLAGQETALLTALYRGIASVALHGAASAIAGHGIWRVRAGGSGAWAIWGIGAAIALHIAYNALSALSLPWAALLAAGVAVVAYMRMMIRVRVLD